MLKVYTTFHTSRHPFLPVLASIYAGCAETATSGDQQALPIVTILVVRFVASSSRICFADWTVACERKVETRCNILVDMEYQWASRWGSAKRRKH